MGYESKSLMRELGGMRTKKYCGSSVLPEREQEGGRQIWIISLILHCYQESTISLWVMTNYKKGFSVVFLNTRAVLT